MIALEQAQRTIIAACRRLPIETLASTQAFGRVLAEEIVSPEDLPPFDNSAMDGFALTCAGMPIAHGREFDVTGAVAAGDAPRAHPDGAVEIMTGAPVPAGFNAILPVELAEILARDADGRPTRIRTLAEVVSGVHIRRRGQDVARSQAVLPVGARIDVVSHMVLAALGVAEVRVFARARVAILCTGRELLDDPRQALVPGQIRNSNGIFLSDRLAGLGADVCQRETLADEAGPFLAAVHRALDACADIVISTGAVSMGRYDFVPEALRELGAEIVFHKVAIRPGKPVLFARLPSGAPFFGLPGNPVSSAVGLRFFAQPALRAMQGLPAETPLRLPLTDSVEKKAGLRFLQKARVSVAGDGRLGVQLLPGQESFRIQPMLAANAWAVLPEMVEKFSAGELVDVFGLEDDAVSVAASGIES
jgi:molybdopterin molybdotransferase